MTEAQGLEKDSYPIDLIMYSRMGSQWRRRTSAREKQPKWRPILQWGTSELLCQPLTLIIWIVSPSICRMIISKILLLPTTSQGRWKILPILLFSGRPFSQSRRSPRRKAVHWRWFQITARAPIQNQRGRSRRAHWRRCWERRVHRRRKSPRKKTLRAKWPLPKSKRWCANWSKRRWKLLKRKKNSAVFWRTCNSNLSPC